MAARTDRVGHWCGRALASPLMMGGLGSAQDRQRGFLQDSVIRATLLLCRSQDISTGQMTMTDERRPETSLLTSRVQAATTDQDLGG